MFSTKNNAFTLSEVLVTLGIIGVLSAMTIPNLMLSTQSAKYRAQFKKTISILNQAGLFAQTNYGFNYGDLDSFDCENTNPGNPNETSSICALLNGALTGKTYMKTSQIKLTDGILAYVDLDLNVMPTVSEMQLSDYVFFMADGAIITLPIEPINCSVPVGTSLTNNILTTNISLENADESLIGLNQCLAYIDVNGAEGPNKEVTCSNEETSLTPETPCKVENNPRDMGDIFPIVFHDAVVEPASNAAKYVLSTSK